VVASEATPDDFDLEKPGHGGHAGVAGTAAARPPVLAQTISPQRILARQPSAAVTIWAISPTSAPG
jgi:hypothetical protein